MGAHICEYGTRHKTCRCRTTHKIKCPTPSECKARHYRPKHKKEQG